MFCERDQRHWDEYLAQVMMAYRSSVHSSTGCTPNMLMLGRNIMPVQAIIPKPTETEEIDTVEVNEYIHQLQHKLSGAHSLAREKLRKNSDYQKRHYDLVRGETETCAPWLYTWMVGGVKTGITYTADQVMTAFMKLLTFTETLDGGWIRS
ncbi:hypothetical protein SNE40_020013 [Patella caerulea]|uniref:Integrase catalytic domain-containing protein n=1 Tax=Patella caerulea TaxID=87958 RepID=A0AAN8G6P6_PATCE